MFNLSNIQQEDLQLTFGESFSLYSYLPIHEAVRWERIDSRELLNWRIGDGELTKDVGLVGGKWRIHKGDSLGRWEMESSQRMLTW